MQYKELIRRYGVFILSTFVLSLGISAIVRADLGTSPISSSSYVFSLNTPLSMGTYLLFLGLILLVVQMLMLGREGIKQKRFDLLVQIPVSVLFGFCTDVAMWLLQDLAPGAYLAKVALLLVGCFVLAVGIALEVSAGVAMMGGECTVQIASQRFKREFGSVKIIFDVTLVVVAVVSSWAFTRTIEGVREGTVIAALITGPFVRLVMPRLSSLRSWMAGDQQIEAVADQSASQAVLITISREYGSGGHDLGEQIAQRLGIPFYDKNLIDMVASELQTSPSYVSEKEQSLTTSRLYKMILQDYEAPLERSLSSDDRLFVAQSRVIGRIAQQGSCVIVGRCANFILDNYPNNINIFLHAAMPYKIERVTARYGTPAEQASAEITRIDRARAEHYNYYTGKRWGDARNYEFCCDSSLLPSQEIVRTVEQIYRAKQAQIATTPPLN